MSSNDTPIVRAKKGVALSGISAGSTALCTVGRSGNDLHYRGYDINDLAETCEFEEVAYLLVHGKLPTAAQPQSAVGGQARHLPVLSLMRVGCPPEPSFRLATHQLGLPRGRHRPLQAAQHQVVASIIQPLDVRDQPRASRRVDRWPPLVIGLLAWLQHHHADDAIPVQGLRHHLSIPRLENMQRQEHVGEQDDVREREEGE